MKTKAATKMKTVPVTRTCGHITQVAYTGPSSTEWSIRTHYNITPCVACKKALAAK